MANKSKFENIVNILSLVLPAILVLISTFFSPYGYANLQETWAKFWQMALIFYVAVFFYLLSTFLSKPKKANKTAKSVFQYWFLGLVLSAFSSVIAHLLWDLAFFINYLMRVEI